MAKSRCHRMYVFIFKLEESSNFFQLLILAFLTMLYLLGGLKDLVLGPQIRSFGSIAGVKNTKEYNNLTKFQLNSDFLVCKTESS